MRERSNISQLVTPMGKQFCSDVQGDVWRARIIMRGLHSSSFMVRMQWKDCSDHSAQGLAMCDLLQGDPRSCPITVTKRLLSVQNGHLSFVFKFFILATLDPRCSVWALHCNTQVAAYGLSCPKACEILVPRLGIEPMSTALEGRFLTTGPPGKPHPLFHLEPKPKSFLQRSKRRLLCPPQKPHTCLMSSSSLPGPLPNPPRSSALTVPSARNAPPLKYLSSCSPASSRGADMSSSLWDLPRPSLSPALF